MATESEIHQLRRDYQREPLDPATFHEDPLVQFRAWFDEARGAGILEPNAMTLGTADGGGRVSCRTVLLKGIDGGGFVFSQTMEAARLDRSPKIPARRCCFPGSRWSVRSR